MVGQPQCVVPVSEIRIGLPPWAWVVDGAERALSSVEARMDLVLQLLERNIAEGGGPFAAAVFDEAGRLVAPGVNRVVVDANPTAHAEIVAIAAAGQIRGTWDLAASGRHQLVTSTEPCAMCLGAVPWSGVSSLVTGARDADARAIGFDEGDKPENWAASLAARRIEVVRDVRRHEVKELLSSYQQSGRPIYNGDNGSER